MSPSKAPRSGSASRSYPRPGGSPLVPRVEDKAGGSGSPPAGRIYGARKKAGEALTEFPGCLGDHRGGHPPAVWHLKLHPQNRLLCSRGGGGSPPDPPIKSAGSSHTSRQRECLSLGPALGFKSSTGAACSRPSGSWVMECQARAISAQHWAGTQTEAMAF